MRHYLRGLAALIEEGHTDEALGRIDALCETNDRTAVRRYCANETVNIALSSLSADINARGITADLRAAVNFLSPVVEGEAEAEEKTESGEE